jgi:hypothetical protein
MESKDIKYLLLIALAIYLLSSYIIGSFDPFKSWQFTRLLEVGVFGLLTYVYFQIKK